MKKLILLFVMVLTIMLISCDKEITLWHCSFYYLDGTEATYGVEYEFTNKKDMESFVAAHPNMIYANREVYYKCKCLGSYE